MFRGLSAINLDSKGRLGLPSRYRDSMRESCDGRCVITIDTESTCLLLYPLEEWEIIERKLETLPSFNQAARRIQRLLIGHATEVDIDASSRVLVPPLLREYGQFQKCVMLVGQGKKFEIWAEELWISQRERWLQEEVMAAESLPTELQNLSL